MEIKAEEEYAGRKDGRTDGQHHHQLGMWMRRRRRHRRQEMKIDFRACQDATVTQWCGRIEGRIGGSEIRIQLKLKHEADT